MTQQTPTQARPDAGQLLKSAASAQPIRAAELKLEAAKLLLAQGDKQRAMQVLAEIDTRPLPPSLAFDISRLRADQALQANDGQSALYYLDRAQLPPSLPQEQQLELNRLRADAYTLQSETLAATRELIAAARLSTDQQQLQQLHNRIWQQLGQLSQEELDNALQSAGNDYYEQGWFELAQAQRQNRDLAGQSDSMQQWRALWQQHPAYLLPPQEINRPTQPLPVISAQRIGLLLPLSGNLAAPARAISQGFYAALFEQSSHAQLGGMAAPEVVSIDSSLVSDPVALFSLAQQQHLDLIVGPLERDYVRRITNLPSLPVPVLALNQADSGSALPFQLDLASEHEAALVAERAWQDGHRRVALITPDADWGRRLQERFAADFQALGGTVVTRLAYQASGDLSAQVSAMLLTDQSRQRARNIRSVVGHSLQTEEYPRDDIDAILMAALPQDARQIKPMLAYHFAGNLPVYATSHLYEGAPDAVRDVDLNGIRFCDLPWVLEPPTAVHQALLAGQGQLEPRFSRLYALGIDAYNVHAYLTQLGQNPQSFVDGETGRLMLNGQRRITRELPWAEFRNGVPALLTETPASE